VTPTEVITILILSVLVRFSVLRKILYSTGPHFTLHTLTITLKIL
jgi:hypothetical protein